MDDVKPYKPLAVVILVGIVLRLIMINTYGIWHDERVSILIANGLHHTQLISGDITVQELQRSDNLPGVVDATILDNGNGLLYNVVLHYWLNLFGNSDLSARLLSVLFSILVIPLVHAFAEKMFNSRRIAITASFIAAIHPLFVAYAQQARPYAMATFFTLLASTIFMNILRDRASFKSYIWYAVWSSCALLTHYLTAYVFIAHAVIFVLEIRSSRLFIHYLLSCALVVLVFFTWMINGGLDGMKVLDAQNAKYALQASNYVDGEKSFAMPVSIKNVITGWVQVWLQVFGNRFQNFGFRIREIGVMVLIPLIAIASLVLQYRKQEIMRKRLIFLLLLIFVQTGFATILAIRSGHCISFQTLYAMFTIPYACVLLGWVLVYLFEYEKYANLAIALSILIYGIMLSSCFTTYLNTNEIFPDDNGHAKFAATLSSDHNARRVGIKSSMDLQLIGIYLPSDANITLYVDTKVVDDSYSVERNP
jgi:uncharacterized membrane protein